MQFQLAFIIICFIYYFYHDFSFLDYILWGDELKETVKGFISVMDIQEINVGFGKNKCRLYIVSPSRTLELEARDLTHAKEWKQLLDFLIQSNMAELDQKRKVCDTPLFTSTLNKLTDDYTKLLREGKFHTFNMLKFISINIFFSLFVFLYLYLLNIGEIFRKWPGKKAIQTGMYTTRLLWTSDNLDRVQVMIIYDDIERDQFDIFIFICTFSSFLLFNFLFLLYSVVG